MRKRVIRISNMNILGGHAKRIREHFDRLVKKDRYQEITLSFRNCPGGDMEIVLDLIEHILRSNVPIRVRNSGKISSAAAVLFLVGDQDKREGTEASSIKLHSMTIIGKIGWITRKDDFARLEAYSTSLFIRAIQFVKARTRLTMDQIEMFFTQDELTFDLTAAIEYGLITKPKEKQS